MKHETLKLRTKINLAQHGLMNLFGVITDIHDEKAKQEWLTSLKEVNFKEWF